MSKTAAIAAGGAVGATMRYFVGLVSTRLFGTDYPWGTVIVNLIGAFLIGFLWGLFEQMDMSVNFKNFVLVGVIGSFTTFSTLSLDAFSLFRSGNGQLAFYHVILTNALGFVLVAAGYLLAQKTFKLASI